jgi:hypothetical protein
MHSSFSPQAQLLQFLHQAILNCLNNKSYNQNVSENEKRRIRARSKKFMIKEIDGLQNLYTKDAKTETGSE